MGLYAIQNEARSRIVSQVFPGVGFKLSLSMTVHCAVSTVYCARR